MLFFLMNPVVMHGGLLVAAAAIPAVFLMIKVYRSDRLEKESPYLIKKLIWAGLFSVLLALVEETVLSFILGLFVPVESPLYNIIPSTKARPSLTRTFNTRPVLPLSSPEFT